MGTLPLTRECFDVALAAGEALSNAYDHACGGEGGSAVYAYPDRVIIEVQTAVAAMRSQTGRSPPRPRTRRDRLRMLVDSVEVRRRADTPARRSV
ncbi:MAG: hypothetical protein ACLTKG_05465 [Collinsella intestinalis]